jgi:outer membrane protein assembly factor BamB
VYVAAGEAIHALRLADGSLAWRSPAGALNGPPLAQNGWLLTNAGNSLSARRAADGSTVWTVESGAQAVPGAIAGDMVVTPLVDGRVVARDLLSGRVLWEQRLGGSPGQPAVIGEDIFVAASDRALYCLDAPDGDIDWRLWVGATIRGAATSDGERVFFSAFDNMVRALDLWNGTLRWASAVSFRPLSGALTAGGAVFVAGPDQGVQILRASDGRASGALAFPGRLAIGPGFASTDTGAIFAAVTGNLEESWRLVLTVPVAVPATAPPPRSGPVPPGR